MPGAASSVKQMDADSPTENDERKLRSQLVAAAAALYAKTKAARSGATQSRPVPAVTDAPGQIAAIALDVMASRRAKIMAVIGSGDVARQQLKMALETRTLDEVRFYSRQPVAATELQRQFRHLTRAKLNVVGSPEEAVRFADIVVLSTESSTPIIDPDWIFPFAYIATTGSNMANRHELPFGLIYRAKTIASDAPQLIARTESHFLAQQAALRRMLHLGMLVDRFNPDRQRGMTLFISGKNGRADAGGVSSQPDYVLAG